MSNENFWSKQCWVCFATDEDDYSASTSWISPCKCRGTAKWVHKSCLERWIDEKQHGNSTTDVLCPQCNTKYIILYPKSGILIKLIEKLDQLINKLCPYVATCIFVGSVYWTTVVCHVLTFFFAFFLSPALSTYFWLLDVRSNDRNANTRSKRRV